MKNVLIFLLASSLLFPSGPQKKVEHYFEKKEKVDSVMGNYRITYEFLPNRNQLIYSPFIEESTGDTVRFYYIGTDIALCLKKNDRTYLKKTFSIKDFVPFLEAEDVSHYDISSLNIREVKDDSVFFDLGLCIPDTDLCYDFTMGVGDDGGISIREANVELELSGYLDNYDMPAGMFHFLSMETSPRFIKERGMCVDERISRYWGRYKEIKDVDTLFNVLVACDFSPQVDVEELALYVYVMGEALDNERLDGYVGELVCARYGALHMYHPACLFQYLHFADEEKRRTILIYLCREWYYAGLSEEALNVLLERHKKNLGQYASEIDELKKTYDAFEP